MSLSNFNSVAGQISKANWMEKQLQINTTEMIPEEVPEKLDQEMDVDGEEEVITQPDVNDKRSANEDIDPSTEKNLRKMFDRRILTY